MEYGREVCRPNPLIKLDENGHQMQCQP
jgi:hypothetical protein